MSIKKGCEVFRVRGGSGTGNPVVLGWSNYTANTNSGGLREGTINQVAQGNRSTAFNYPYSIQTFGRKEDTFSGSSTYDRITVYGAPWFPATWDGAATTNSNNSNVALYGNLQWSDYVGADNRGQRLGSASSRIDNAMKREMSSVWRMAVRTESGVTGYNSGGVSITTSGNANGYVWLSNSKMQNDYGQPSEQRVFCAPITDSHDGRHVQSGPNAGLPFDYPGTQQRRDVSEVMGVWYDSTADTFNIKVVGKFDVNNRAINGARIQMARLFVVEGFEYQETASSSWSSAPYPKITRFYLEDATFQTTTQATQPKWYHKGNDIRYNKYVQDYGTTTIKWSNITTNPFYDTVTNTGHSESTSTTQWNALVYPVRS